MALDTKLAGSTSGNGVEADTDNQLLVKTNVDPEKAGSIRTFSENDPGTVVTGGLLLSPETSEDFRLRVGIDGLLDQESFGYTNQHSGKHQHTSTTMTTAIVGGALTTNSGLITTTTTGAMLRTYRQFQVGGQQAPTYVEMNVALTAATMATNSTVDIGLFLTSGANPFAPTDGAYVRFNASGVHLVTFNSTSTELVTTLASFVPVVNRVYQIVLAITNRAVLVWVDDVLHEHRDVAVGLGQLFNSGSLPFAIRHAIVGGAAGSAVSCKLFSYSIYSGDVDRVKDWGATCTTMGGSQQVQQGATVGGQLATYALGAAPAASTLTASTAPAINTLGGKWLATIPAAAAESDFPMFAWLNPAGTTAIPGKTWICTGIRICETTVTTVLGGPMCLEWGVGFGSTASTLATTESASFAAATTKIARKLHLGSQGVVTAAAVGTTLPGFQVDFSSAPLCVNPGEYLHVIMRSVLATVSGACRGGVAVIGYFE